MEYFSNLWIWQKWDTTNTSSRLNTEYKEGGGGRMKELQQARTISQKQHRSEHSANAEIGYQPKKMVHLCAVILNISDKNKIDYM